MRFGSIPWLKFGLDALWLQPDYVHGANLVGGDVAPTRLKVHGKFGLDAFWLHPNKFVLITATVLLAYICIHTVHRRKQILHATVTKVLHAKR
jgi:hypothetical protein